ncbi:T9SS type A sorting domain-containing protein [Flavivirga jejuensis]|uniref:T9SS type A sorting domain-containing protein n=1 Tax=Flavivirga jejuensis TaxID=870487 RepID=A0ABT8WT82_9FLAO|nr:T9SS type A sorting domain-containing protein [Flavivirga jejuensis]MDO5976091.1 T9SS type A sorting domain-containing protein [Flavivirga jejuensis]
MTNFKALLFFITSIIPLGLMAQLSFEEIEITGKDDVIFNPKLLDHENLDLDQDGDFDILVNSLLTIVWYENRDGAGDFSSAKMIYNGDTLSIQDMQIGDLDGDGDLDIVCSLDTVGLGPNKIGWITNLGDGNFSDFNEIEEFFTYIGNIEISDIDGDNDIDILLHQFEGVVWYENLDGLGTFTNLDVVIPPLDSFTSGIFMLEDVNDDSKIDIVLYDPSLNQISWYENLGNMTFSAALPFHENLTSSPYVLKKVDIDGDTNADFIASSYNNLIWYEFDGIGELSQTIISIEGYNADNLISTDFDSDGDQDLLGAHKGSLFWLENNDGMGTFSIPKIIDYKNCSFCSNTRDRLATGDFDGNGTIDVITSLFSSTIGTIYKYSNLDGQGTFDSRKIISEYPFIDSIESIDIDNDGDLDLLSKNYFYTSIYRNLDGNGNFGRKEALSGSDYLKDSEPIDVDNDGDLDIVSIREEPNADLVWYENIDGSGIFKNAQVINSTIEINLGTTVSDIAAGDIDKDGYQDFVLVQYKEDETVYWLRNENGSGTFSSPIEVGTNVDSPGSVQLGDIDGDGDLDVVVFEAYYPNLVKWFENADGNGSFAPAVILPNIIATRGICLEDLDQDNDLDVITFGKDIKWHENTDGTGNFSAPMLIGNPNEFIQFVEITDLDGDFDKDIVWKSWGKDGILWYENLTGNEDFSAEIPIFITNRTSVNPATALGDFNGDFKVDIAHSDTFEYYVGSSTYTPDRLIVLLNEGEQGNQIIGKVTNDYDSSGCDDMNNPIIKNLMITSSDGVNSYSTFTLPNGLYNLNVGEGTYTTTVSGTLPNYYGANPSEHEFTFDGIGTTEFGDFCIEAEQEVHDLEVQLFPLLEVRPGFETKYLLTYKNVGTTVLEGEVNLNFNESALNFIEASEAPSSILSGELTFNIDTLLPFESNSIQANFLVEPPPTVNIDDLFVTSAHGTITGEDDFLENNEFILEQVVIGSFDPNDIQVIEGSKILVEDLDDYLHYIIRFQNTGTASAINVKVINELDSNLNWESFQILETSHSADIQITNGEFATFTFNDINLPDSNTNEEGSSGFITYKIKPNSNLQISDSMLNTADIYFDFNQPITTNTVMTTVTELLSVSDFKSSVCKMYPVPLTNSLNISCHYNDITQLELYDIQGKFLIKKLLSGQNDVLNVSDLPLGVYIVKLREASGAVKVYKVIK